MRSINIKLNARHLEQSGTLRIAELSDHGARNSEFRRNAQDNPERSCRNAEYGNSEDTTSEHISRYLCKFVKINKLS